MIKEKTIQLNTKESLVYCSYSSTIRQMPQNYMVARRIGGVWVCDSDSAVDVKVSLMVHMTLICDMVKFLDGVGVVDAIERTYNDFKIDVCEADAPKLDPIDSNFYPEVKRKTIMLHHVLQDHTLN